MVSFFIKESVWNFSAKKEHKMFKLCLCHVHILFKIVEYTNYNRENKESKKQFRYNRRNEICIIQIEDKRENDNNIEPIHGHGENEREEKVFSENESHVQESRELEQNVTAEDAKAEEVKNEHPQQTITVKHCGTTHRKMHSPCALNPKRRKRQAAQEMRIRNLSEKKKQKNLFMQLAPEKRRENRKKIKIAMRNM